MIFFPPSFLQKAFFFLDGIAVEMLLNMRRDLPQTGLSYKNHMTHIDSICVESKLIDK